MQDTVSPSFATQNLTKLAILKMIVVRDTLVCDSGSESWFAYQPFPVLSLFLCLGPSFIGAVIPVISQLGQKPIFLARNHVTASGRTAISTNTFVIDNNTFIVILADYGRFLKTQQNTIFAPREVENRGEGRVFTPWL